MEKLFYVAIWILILGGISILILNSVNKNIKKYAINSKVQNDIANYYTVKKFKELYNLKAEIVVHTGSAVMYHRGKKIIYLNEKVAKSKELYSLSACLHEAGEALAREKCPVPYLIKTYVTMIIRGITMLVPLMLVISLLLKKQIVFNLAIIVLAANIIYSILLSVIDYFTNKPVKQFVEGMEWKSDDKKMFNMLLDSYSFDILATAFKPFENLFKYASQTLSSMEDVRRENYEKAIEDAEKKRQKKINKGR